MSGNAVVLIGALAAARKAVQLYPPAHPAYAEAVDGLIAAVAEASALGPFVLNVHQGRLYEGSAVLPSDAPGVPGVEEALEARKVESLTFMAGFGRDDALGLTDVLGARLASGADIQAELEARGVRNVLIASLVDDEESEERAERERIRERDRGLYRQLVGTLRTFASRMNTQGAPDVGEAAHLVQDILGRLAEDEAAVLGLATMQSGQQTWLYHSLNVMIYALTLGLALGLPEEGLTSLGMAALLHDIGKAAFDETDPEQTARAQGLHPTIGAEILSRLPDEDSSSMLVAYEHHMAVDGTGYPARPADYVAHPYSRMVAIADRYEHLTAFAEGEEALTPDRAVGRLLAEAGTLLDPWFTRLFAKAMGAFPVGCIVRLSDQSVGVVAAGGADIMTPKVRLVYDSDGLECEEPEEFEVGAGGIDIVEVLQPDDLRLTVSEHL